MKGGAILLFGILAVACGPVVDGSTGEGADGTGASGGTSGAASSGPGDSSPPGTHSGVPPMTTAGDVTTSVDPGTTGGSTSYDDDESGSPGGFLGPYKDVGRVPESCTPREQDCPDGMKCVWYSFAGQLRREAAQCIPVTGDRAPFESCTLPNGIGVDIEDDCGADSYCLDVYGTADHGFCAPFSTGTCEAYEGAEPVFENGSDFPAACLMHPCNLFENTCPDGMRCMFYPASIYAQAMCWSEPDPPDLPLGAACDFGGCGPGRMCVESDWLPDCDHDRCCAEVCEFPGGECEVLETSCEFVPVWGAGLAGGNAGGCLLPGLFD